MEFNKYLDVAPEGAAALKEGKAVVALESTIISHGMPYPKNVETALNVEKVIRENGAVPATIAIIGVRLKAGLSKEEIEAVNKIVDENVEFEEVEEDSETVESQAAESESEEEEEYFCPDCGAKISLDMKHCPSCGVELVFEEE